VPTQLKVTSDSEIPELSTEDMRSDDKSSKKVVRNTSNNSKRKIRLRRVGSRQNSKTESDSDEEFAQNTEAQRKAKRKTSRAKKQLESDKSFDSFQGEDEVVYVFKIKPGETNEMIVKSNEQIVVDKSSSNNNNDDSVLISPTENCVELIDAHDLCQNSFTNPIVKTKRKIFTPFENGMSENANTTTTCISHEIESSSSSEKTTDKQREEEMKSVQVQGDESQAIESEVNEENCSKSQAPEKPPRKHEFVKQGNFFEIYKIF
jgi:serine/arginine repetitive matrix protein 2